MGEKTNQMGLSDRFEADFGRWLEVPKSIGGKHGKHKM
jgi:hypothetical protein